MAEKRRITQQDIVIKTLIVFGQGTGCMRISTEAARCVEATASQIVENNKEDLLKNWDKYAVQFLERARIMGRVAERRAIGEARTYIDKEDVTVAIRRVGMVSKTYFCPGREEDKPDY